LANPSNPEKRLIAVCGESSTGKTPLTAMMTRVLLESSKAGKEHTRALKLDRRLGIAPICREGLRIEVHRSALVYAQIIPCIQGVDRFMLNTRRAKNRRIAWLNN
jgi:hypothetical protein